MRSEDFWSTKPRFARYYYLLRVEYSISISSRQIEYILKLLVSPLILSFMVHRFLKSMVHLSAKATGFDLEPCKIP